MAERAGSSADHDAGPEGAPARLPRRVLLAGAIGALPGTARAAGLREEWHAFRDRFLAPEGRILDTGNGGISHSEGQGWTLLFAAAANDLAAFRLVHGWTRRALARPSDSLFAWRFRPGGAPPVDDPNNATDGDLYIAWALARAGWRWHDPALLAAAAAIGRDVLRLLTREVAGRLVLLPGAAGFENADRIVVNPSYLVLPAYAALDRVVPDPRWRRLASDGLALLRHGRFGRWGLPPDWLAIRRADGGLAPAAGWPPRFSFDAVRIPLLLAWGGHRQEPAVAAALRFWRDPGFRQPPAWADLHTDAVADFPLSEGGRSIAAYAALQRRDAVPVASLGPGDDYYSASLKMLVRVAVLDET